MISSAQILHKVKKFKPQEEYIEKDFKDFFVTFFNEYFPRNVSEKGIPMESQIKLMKKIKPTTDFIVKNILFIKVKVR
jgi:hypothetical protein